MLHSADSTFFLGNNKHSFLQSKWVIFLRIEAHLLDYGIPHLERIMHGVLFHCKTNLHTSDLTDATKQFCVVVFIY